MQAKGLIRVFVIVLLLVCLYHLSFTFLTSRVEKRAEDYAKEQINLPAYDGLRDDTVAIANLMPDLEARYLDSVYNTPELNLGFVEYTYGDLKKYQLGLGLDLSGGMSITLQVSMDQLLEKMSDNSKDAAFLAALDEARKEQLTANTDFITLFADAYAKQPNKTSLAAIFATTTNKDKIKYNDSDETVIAAIREEANAAFSKTVEIVRARVDGLGVANPNITEQTLTQRIEIELPGIKNPARARNLLQSTAELEFWETWENAEVAGGFDEANKIVAEYLGYDVDSSKADNNVPSVEGEDATTLSDDVTSNEEVDADSATLSSLTATDSASASTDSTGLQSDDAATLRKQYPLYGTQYSLIQPNIFQTEQGGFAYGQGSVVGYSYGNDRDKVEQYLSDPQVRALFPKNIKFLWSAKMLKGTSLYALHVIKTATNTDEAPLGGDDIADARRDSDPVTGLPIIKMSMTSTGAQKWKRLTTANLKKIVAIVMDNKVYTAPTVQSVMSYESQITGDFTVREAEDLASIIRAGKLPAPAVIVEEAVVGSTLGSESINAGLYSLLGGLLLVLTFMVFYYSKAGIIADLVLFLNLIFILGTLASFGAALTLPGIAGIVLTIGMAVDANVIIFERIKEELEKGKSVLSAISDGYSKSYSAIIDANITTLLTGGVLYYFGVGPIRGFALILIIGIVSSLITAVLVSRLLMERVTSSGGNMTFFINATKSVLAKANYQFIQKRKLSYIISGTIITLGIVSMLTRGFELGVDFQGGRSYQVRFDQTVSVNDVRKSLSDNLENASMSVKTFGATSLNQLKIVTSYKIDETGSEVDSIVDAKVYESLKGFYKTEPTYETFSDEYKVAASKTGPTIASDIRTAAIYATIFSLIIIFLYILLRFRKAEFAIGALVTTTHDVLMLLSIFSIFKGLLPFSLEIDQNFIAAILTVIGYSLNDTVIVFDRIREYLFEYPSKKVSEVTNLAINSTLSRTLITSLTTLVVVLMLFLFGGEVIQGFAFALLVGIGFGTYSSIFIAAPLVVDIQSYRDKKEVKK